MNDEPNFDRQVTDKLGCYVYTLHDPLRDKVFYVGKGGGSDEGNQRVLDHFSEAREALSEEKVQSEKVKRIHEIWKAGKEVEWKIVRAGMGSSEEALHCESTLIDHIGIENLTNVQGGSRANRSGILAGLTRNDVYALAAEDVAPENDYPLLLIFNIKEGRDEGRSLYDATRMSWTDTRNWEARASHAVGLIDRVSRCVIEIQGWEPGTESDRRAFHGKHYIEPGSHELLSKKFNKVIDQASSGFWGFGGWLACEIKKGEFYIQRGISNSG